MRKKLRKILSYSIIFVIGMCAAIVVTVYAATYSSSDVGYTNNGQTTVEGALDNLYTKANTLNSQLTTCQANLNSRINPSDYGIDFTSEKRIYANGAGICIEKNGDYVCFSSPSNYTDATAIQNTRARLQLAIGSCTTNSGMYVCTYNHIECKLNTTNGSIVCIDWDDRTSNGKNACSHSYAMSTSTNPYVSCYYER